MAAETTHERGKDKLELWQFKIVDFGLEYRGEDPEDILNSLGQQGRELVAVTPPSRDFTAVANLKRKSHGSA